MAEDEYVRVQFGEFVLDRGQRVLVRDGVEQALEPKVFDCLALLVGQAGRLTSMEQLRSTLWPDVSVGEGALRRVINEARRALGDTGAVQSLIRTRKGVGYVFVGEVRDGVPAAKGAPVAIDARAGQPQAQWPFVGRQRELERLRAWTAEGSDGGLCLLSGEAGAGKSSLLLQLQRERKTSARQLIAQCRAGVGLPAFWPFRETAAQLMRDPLLRARAAPFTHPAGSVLRAFPELAGGSLAGHGAEVPGQQRFELCEAFALLLCELSQAAPLWLVVEDVHWADAGDVEMLEAIARHARGKPLHVFASYRPEAIAAGKALSQWIGRTSGREGVFSVHLPALALDDVQALLRAVHVPGWAGPTSQGLQQLTGGNALFLSELVRHALALGLPLESSLPPSLSHIVAQRVAALPEITQRRLDQAALLGHEFQLEVLAALADAPGAAALLCELEPALRAGVLCPASDSGDRLRFSHALVCDTLVQRLSFTERTAGHATALRAWQRLRGPAAPSGALAEHAFEAGVQLPGEERRSLCEHAGRDAYAQLAFDRAALHLGRAVQLLDANDSSRAAAELSLLWAKALNQADEPEDEIEAAYLQAAARARAANLPELLAEAAIGYAVGDESSVRLRGVALRPEALELAEEAWARLVQATPEGAGVDGLRGELPYRLAAALCWMRGEAGELADFTRAAQQALRLAPSAPDPFRRRWLLALRRAAGAERNGQPYDAGEDLVQADDLEPAQRIELWLLRMGACLSDGDVQGFEHGVNEVTRLVALLPQPWTSGRRGARMLLYRAIAACARVTLLVIRGELEAALQRLTALREQGTRMGTTVTREQSYHAFSMVLQLCTYVGVASRLEPLLERHLEANPQSSWFVALDRMQCALERGEREVAAQHYAVLRETGFRPVLRGKQCLAKPETLVRAADGCRELGTPADAAILYEALLPRAGRCIQDGTLICFGSCARPLAELAVVQGRHAQAEQHFSAALAMNERLGHRPECARTQFGWARLLLLQGRTQEAAQRLQAARAIATRSGMRALLVSIEQAAT